MTINGYNDLFNSSKVVSENIVKININQLHSFKNHPFKVVDDEDMDNLVESIRNKGVLNPIIIRECSYSDVYEIISGHRRKRAAELAGLTEVPALIKNISDDDAIIEMVDSNIYRESILPSEKAFSYRMKQNALKHQGKKGNNTNEEIGKDLGDSGRQVQRYIRLTYLIPELLEYVDNNNISLIPAVDLSYIDKTGQELLYQYIDDNNIYPNLKTAKSLKEAFNANKNLTIEIIDSILKKKTASKERTFKLSEDLVNKYFVDMDKKSIELKINEIISDYFLNKQGKVRL